MGLKSYHEKRRFDETPEPRGGRPRVQGPLRFVVQKHRASRLHYDFRLEVGGTLKSWAVPKGPSMDPREKRLAVMVEDHPLDYRGFEGTIPAGNYGAGTVLVWDSGTYGSAETADRETSERQISEGLEKGHLRFVVEGEKLKGAFSLIRLKKGDGKSWLLVKGADEFAANRDVTEDDRSVLSRRTLDEIARGDPPPAKDQRQGQSHKTLFKDAPRAKMPRLVKPMLATLVDQPFDRAGWIFEPKWDGYRAIAEVSGKGVAMYSRNHTSFDTKFAPVVRALESLGHEVVLDGEVVVVDSRGKSQFQLLQNYQKTGEGRLLYYVFDLLHLDGHDLRGLPLTRRKQVLATILGASGAARLSEHVEERGVAFFEAARSLALEGIIAKDGESVYSGGKRGRDWLKIKTHRRQEAVVAGFTEPRGRREHLGALLLGVYEGDELVSIGHTGGGFGARDLASVRAKLEPLVRPTSPFRRPPEPNAPVHWVEPSLVCEISFQEWTESGVARHPVFAGFREDKPACEVRREVPVGLPEVAPGGHRVRVGVKAAKPGENPRRTAKSRRPGSRAPLTNPEKVYWPDDGYTKSDLAAYYREVAPLILPYLRDRPESLHRQPNGIAGEGFFQKDFGRRPPPDWVRTVKLPSGPDDATIEYLVCQDEDTLLYLANLGCIELNPWNSRLRSLEKPDYLVVDLDPEAIAFPRVIEAALAVRRVLEDAGAESVCKTSGKTGLHVFVPLGARYTYEQARQFAEIVATIVHRERPDSTSLVRSPAQRQGRVYLDFLQNRRGQTLAAPYCVRPVAGAPVSTPLKWGEVRAGLDPAKFTMKTLPKRVAKVGDLWERVLGAGVNLGDCLDRLTSRTRGSRASR